MSTSDEEARALRRAYDFLLDIGSGRYKVTSIRELRAEARRILKHRDGLRQENIELRRTLAELVAAWRKKGGTDELNALFAALTDDGLGDLDN